MTREAGHRKAEEKRRIQGKQQVQAARHEAVFHPKQIEAFEHQPVRKKKHLRRGERGSRTSA
jgi:hypothetical protein